MRAVNKKGWGGGTGGGGGGGGITPGEAQPGACWSTTSVMVLGGAGTNNFIVFDTAIKTDTTGHIVASLPTSVINIDETGSYSLALNIALRHGKAGDFRIFLFNNGVQVPNIVVRQVEGDDQNKVDTYYSGLIIEAIDLTLGTVQVAIHVQSVSGAGTIDMVTNTVFSLRQNRGVTGATGATGPAGAPGVVQSITGTANRITIGGTAADPTVDVSTSYVGQTTITTLGTITTGAWQGTAIADAYIASAATWNGKVNKSGDTMTGYLILNADPISALGAVTKQYADALVTGLWDDRGNYDASTNLYPATGGSGTAGAILKGDIWTISVAGTLGGTAVSVGDTVRALVDTPGQTASNWALGEADLGYTPLSNVLNSAQVFVGNASNVATGVAMTGDISITNAGVTAIGAGKVTTTMLASTTGSGTVVALATSPVLVTPLLGTPTSGVLTNCTGYPASALAGTTLAAGVVSSSLTSLGTIATGVWQGTAVGVAYGGTGLTSYTTGDILYASGTTTLSKLAATTNGFVLTLAAGVPTWAAAGTGTVTTTGSPANGNLAKFSGATSVTNGDLSGDVTTSGTLACTIANSAVTYAKIQNVSATDKLLGRSTAGAGVVEEIACTAGGRTLIAKIAPTQIFNQSTANQGPGFSSDTYITGSSISIPNSTLQAGSRYHCIVVCSKTGAGTATPILRVRFGTAGTTADTALVTHTYTNGTAAADQGVFHVWVTFNSVGGGTSAVIQSSTQITHKSNSAGIVTNASEVDQAASSGFDSTVSNSIIGLSLNAGGSASWTIQTVWAELQNLL